MKRHLRNFVICACLLITTAAQAAGPNADASLFMGDFQDPNALDVQWIRHTGNIIHADGIGTVNTTGSQEGWARANSQAVPNDWPAWITTFDVMLNASTGAGFRIFDPYSANLEHPVDIQITIENWDWAADYPGGPVWDFHIKTGAADPNNQSVGLTTRLQPNQWHQFAVYHRHDDMVELWVNSALLGVYPARNPAEKFAELQIGDVSTGDIWGNVSWDNISIGRADFSALDGTVFSEDFSSGDLNQWERIEGLMSYDAVNGNPPGCMTVITETATEGFARKYLADDALGSAYTVEFDVKVSDSTGGGMRLYQAYSNDGYNSNGIRLSIEAFDWNPNDWDLHVTDATGSSSVTANLDNSLWHHVKMIHNPDDTVDLYINDTFIANYQDQDTTYPLQFIQFGDFSGGWGYGNVSWDNILITAPLAGICGDDRYPYPIGDLNLDCFVGIQDLAQLALQWLQCSDPACQN